MISYHSDVSLKEMIVAEMQRHKDHDQFVKGTYGEDKEKWGGDTFKGCAVGCAIDSINIRLKRNYSTNDHKAFEETIGVPVWLAKLQDELFELLPHGEDSQFAVEFLEAIPVGMDLEPVKSKFLAFILKDSIEKVSNLPDIPEDLRTQVLNAIQNVLTLHQQIMNNQIVENDMWEDAASDAASAAAWAAWAAWAAGAAWAAKAAARAAKAASDARAAAWAAKAAVQAAAWAAASAASDAASTASAAWAASDVAWAAKAAAWDASWAASDAASAAAKAATIKKYAQELLRLLREEKIN